MNEAQEIRNAHHARDRVALESAIARIPVLSPQDQIDRDLRNAYEAHDRHGLDRAIARTQARQAAMPQTATAQK